MDGDAQQGAAAEPASLRSARLLEARICELFRGFITDWCGYELSVTLTAQAARRSQSFVRRVLARQPGAGSY